MDANEKKSKPKSREYPAVTLDAAVAFVEKFRDYPQNKPISYDVAAETCGVKATTNSFKYTLSSARQYGLISTSSGKTISFWSLQDGLLGPQRGRPSCKLSSSSVLRLLSCMQN